MSHDDFEKDPLDDLATTLPAGETVLWQGRPNWPTLMRKVMHIDLLAMYFAALLGWRLVSAHYAGASLQEALRYFAVSASISLAAIGVLALIAWGIGRTTTYVLTSRRLLLRFGVALPVTLNIPLKDVTSASVRPLKGGRGDVALQVLPGTRLAYLVLWPHARPWHLSSPEPMLRAIDDVETVSRLLATSLKTAGQPNATRAATSFRIPAEAKEALVAAE